MVKNKWWRQARPAVVLLLLLLLPGGAAWAGEVRVIAGIPPAKYLVDRLGVDARLLLAAGRDPHLFVPTPGQLRELQGATLYISCGLPFEQLLAGKLRGANGVRIVDAVAGVPQAADHDAVDGDHHDLHLWLAPPILAKMAANITAALITVDPRHREEYRARLAGLQAEIEHLHQEIGKRLAPFINREFFVQHGAFGHFAATYGLVQRAVSREGKKTAPRRLAGIIAAARKAKARVLFTQPQFDRRAALTVAAAMGAEVVELDPLAYDVLANYQRISRELERAFIAGGREEQ